MSPPTLDSDFARLRDVWPYLSEDTRALIKAFAFGEPESDIGKEHFKGIQMFFNSLSPLLESVLLLPLLRSFFIKCSESPSSPPQDEAKSQAFKLIRRLKNQHPWDGAKKITKRLEGKKDFRELLESAGATSQKEKENFVCAALKRRARSNRQQGRKPLNISPDPQDKATWEAYEKIREARKRNPKAGMKKLMEILKGDEAFEGLLTSLGATSPKKRNHLFLSARKWFYRHPTIDKLAFPIKDGQIVVSLTRPCDDLATAKVSALEILERALMRQASAPDAKG